jgi:2-phosphoglycerate kinase
MKLKGNILTIIHDKQMNAAIVSSYTPWQVLYIYEGDSPVRVFFSHIKNVTTSVGKVIGNEQW